MEKKGRIKIEGSLSAGELYSTRAFVLIYSAFAIAVLATFAVIIVSLVENNAAYLLAALLPAALAVMIGYFVACDAAKRLRCSKCLKDGARVTAKCEKVMADADEEHQKLKR